MLCDSYKRAEVLSEIDCSRLLKVLVSTKNTEVSLREMRGRGRTWMDRAWMERVIREDQMSRCWNMGRAAGELKMS
jgi:hypothetical protein